jgi:hypothetical protein
LEASPSLTTKYLGKKEDFESAVSKLSECVDSDTDVECFIFTDGFIADTETTDITLKTNIKYTVGSLFCLSVTLDVVVVNVEGTCNFTSLKV